ELTFAQFLTRTLCDSGSYFHGTVLQGVVHRIHPVAAQVASDQTQTLMFRNADAVVVGYFAAEFQVVVGAHGLADASQRGDVFFGVSLSYAAYQGAKNEDGGDESFHCESPER